MIIYPAIDLMGGKCVRLVQGKRENCTVYSDNPAEIAARWLAAGARWLHVVDLDAALDEHCFSNLDAINKIIGEVAVCGMKVQVGGGIRTAADIARYIDEGVSRVIVGTKAFESRDFAADIVVKFGETVAIGLDARDGKVAVKGWTSVTELTIEETAADMDTLGAKTLIVTDIRRDGMLTEPNFDIYETLCRTVKCKVIASGGVSDITHIARLHELSKKHPNLDGAIAGKALYENRLDLAEAVRLYQE